jgi:hypothetical protein
LRGFSGRDDENLPGAVVEYFERFISDKAKPPGGTVWKCSGIAGGVGVKGHNTGITLVSVLT